MVYREGSCPGFPIVGGMGGALPHPAIFFENSHPIKTDAPQWGGPPT